MQYESTISLDQAADLLRQHRQVTVTTHAKPDGDAFGSVIALAGALRAMGSQVEARFMPPVPAALRTLKGQALARELAPGEALPEAPLTVILDTGAWSQLAPIKETLAARLGKTLILDHHLSGDVDARWRYIDGSAGSCCEVVAQVIDRLGQAPGRAPGMAGPGAPVGPDALIDPAVADALFVGIASDTGWFRFSNTRAVTHLLAARLLGLGVDHAALFQKLEQTERPEKLALMIRAMASMRLIAGGRAAVMTLKAEDFAATGAHIEETERFVDLPQAVSTIEVVAILTETPAAAPGKPTGPVRLSFRSKPGPRAVNVATLAQTFGGGGHARAAGGKVDAPLADVVARVDAAVAAALAAV
ncbi:MAG: DHH family phosphoesterase [Planctomycetota bacterium]|nr:DHH family phosphoesterase [Planctomycetota bacterium]